MPKRGALSLAHRPPPTISLKPAACAVRSDLLAHRQVIHAARTNIEPPRSQTSCLGCGPQAGWWRTGIAWGVQ